EVHAEERPHAKPKEPSEGPLARPFLGGTSLDVDRALTEIAVFSAMVGCLPRGPGSLILDLGAGPCWRKGSAGSPTAAPFPTRCRSRSCSEGAPGRALPVGAAQ